jgi:hypothetical protein
MYHSIWQSILGRHTFTSDLITLGSNSIYHFILNYALRLTYLYKRFYYTRLERKVSFHSDKPS